MSEQLFSRVHQVQVAEIKWPPHDCSAVKPTRAALRAGLDERIQRRRTTELDEQSCLRDGDDFSKGLRANAKRSVAKFRAR